MWFLKTRVSFCIKFALWVELQAELLENLFPLTAERGGENYDLLYQNSIRKYGDDLEHLCFGFLYFV